MPASRKAHGRTPRVGALLLPLVQHLLSITFTQPRRRPGEGCRCQAEPVRAEAFLHGTDAGTSAWPGTRRRHGNDTCCKHRLKNLASRGPPFQVFAAFLKYSVSWYHLPQVSALIHPQDSMPLFFFKYFRAQAPAALPIVKSS